MNEGGSEGGLLSSRNEAGTVDGFWNKSRPPRRSETFDAGDSVNLVIDNDEHGNSDRGGRDNNRLQREKS